MLAQSPAGPSRPTVATPGRDARSRGRTSRCAGLELLQRRVTSSNFSIALTPRVRVEPCVDEPGNDQPEGQRSRVGGDDARRAVGSATQAGLADVTTLQGRERTRRHRPPRRDGVHGHAACASVMPERHTCGDRAEDRGDATLHVTVPRPHMMPSSIRSRNGSLPGQAERSPGGTTSMWPLSASAGVPLSARDADAPHASSARPPSRGSPGRGPVGHIDVPQVDVRSEVLHPLGAPALDVELAGRAVDGRDRHEVGERADDLVRIDLREHALVVGVRDVRRGGHMSRMPAGSATQRSPAEKGLGGAAPLWDRAVRLSLLRQQREPVRAERLTDRLPGMRHRGGRGHEGFLLVGATGPEAGPRAWFRVCCCTTTNSMQHNWGTWLRSSPAG